MKKKNLIGLIIISILILVGAIVYFKGNKMKIAKQESAQNKEIKVGLLQNLDDVNFVFDFAQQKKIFENKGLKVDPVVLASDSDNVMQSGQIDLRIGDLSGTISSFLNDANPRWIASPFNRFGSVAISRFGKDEANKIKKVAIIKAGTAAQVISDIALRNLGVDTNNVEYVAAPSDAAREEMLANGSADFTILMSENYLQNSGKMDKYSVYSSNELFGGTSFLRAITTTEEKIKEKPDSIQLFTDGIYETVKYLQQNKTEAIAFLQTKYGYSSDGAEKFYQEFIQSSIQLNYVPDANQLKELAKGVVDDLKPTDSKRDLTSFVDTQFAKKTISKY